MYHVFVTGGLGFIGKAWHTYLTAHLFETCNCCYNVVQDDLHGLSTLIVVTGVVKELLVFPVFSCAQFYRNRRACEQSQLLRLIMRLLFALHCIDSRDP